MNRAASRKPTHFSIFRSAAEEADMKREEQAYDNEGGRASSQSAANHCLIGAATGGSNS